MTISDLPNMNCSDGRLEADAHRFFRRAASQSGDLRQQPAFPSALAMKHGGWLGIEKALVLMVRLDAGVVCG